MIEMSASQKATWDMLRPYGWYPGDYIKTCKCGTLVKECSKDTIRCRWCAIQLRSADLQKLREFDLLTHTQRTCELVGRGPEAQPLILAQATAELGELADEVLIAQGVRDEAPGPDGILGEAADLINAALDLIHSAGYDLTSDEVKRAFIRKQEKWISKYGKLHKPESFQTR